MSFHEDMFHETKRERKYYEDRKQKALRYLDHTMNILHDDILNPNLTKDELYDKVGHKLKELKKRVNDI